MRTFAAVVVRVALVWAALAIPSTSSGQGCSLCRDATAGSTLQARRAFRVAIPLLGIPAIGIFAGILIAVGRVRPGRSFDVPPTA
jgi:hypothetical protein